MIYFILFLGLILRLININQSLWLDEAINILAAKNLGFWQFVTDYPIGDFHPPGYFAILWVWSHIFGFSELAVRFPSIIFGVVTIWLTYILGRDLFNKRVGLIGAFFLAIGPLHIYYSQEARMYGFAAFSAALSFYFLSKLLQGKKYAGWFYSLSVVLVLYSDYLVYFIIPSQIIFLLWSERKKLSTVMKFLFLGALGILPWLIIFPTQLASGRVTAENVPGWQKVVGGSSIKSLLLVGIKSIIGRVRLSENFTIYAILMSLIGFLEGVILFSGIKKLSREIRLMICWLVLPIIFAFTISIFVPILSYFRMIFILPAFYLLLANGVYNLKRNLSFSALITISLISLISLSIYYLNPLYQRENWKELTNFLETNSDSSTLTLFEDSNLPAPFAYYNKGEITARGGLSHFPANNMSDVISINPDFDKIFLVNYLVEISDPNRTIDRKLTSVGYKVIKLHDIPSLGYIYEYSK